MEEAFAGPRARARSRRDADRDHVLGGEVLLRIKAAQLMVLSDAVPDLHIGGKPQCHIVALAKEGNVVAASTGCALSRIRTGMTVSEMTAAIPAGRVTEVVARVEATVDADDTVATYAAQDSRRFG
ncbi:MAG: hypothetical protein ABR529_07320 [Actinomycetota bacterium]